MEFIIAKNQINEPLLEPDKIEIINDQFEIWYYDEGRLPPISVGVNSYSGIPKCLAVIGTEGLEKSGVFRLQNEFNPGLFGNGVYVAIIDTGVNFALPSFIRNNGTSKVAVLWDQKNEQVYDNSQINAAIRTDDPYEIIPAQDEDGHGTFIAGIICGQENRENDFTGIAPEAQLIVIKLKPAEKELKDFFFIPDEKLVFSEADIMRGIAFAERYASQNNRPMVVCLALGCNNGSHNGTENLCEYIDGITSERGRTVVVGAGNEANARHHYQGSTTAKPADVEINVEKDLENKDSIYRFYQKAINLRKSNEILIDGAYALIAADDSDIIAFVRESGNQKILVICSFADKKIKFNNPFKGKGGKLLLSNYETAKPELNDVIYLQPYEGRAYIVG